MIRSIHTPASGASRDGIAMKKKVKPARALEPVSVFTQMLSTSSITESPNMEVVRPAYRRAKPGVRNASFIGTPPGR